MTYMAEIFETRQRSVQAWLSCPASTWTTKRKQASTWEMAFRSWKEMIKTVIIEAWTPYIMKTQSYMKMGTSKTYITQMWKAKMFPWMAYVVAKTMNIKATIKEQTNCEGGWAEKETKK